MNSNGKNVKVALLNCYFGKFPNYFGLWLQSCRNNPGIDFILVTDAKIQYEIPSNVIVIRLTWDELMERIEVKFDFPIVITSPYKLTDFKPAYGFVFDDIFFVEKRTLSFVEKVLLGYYSMFYYSSSISSSSSSIKLNISN